METKDKVRDLKKVLEGKKNSSSKDQTETAAEEIETFEQELKEAQEETKQTNDKLLRTLADFENYKKRIHKEQQDLAKHSAERFVRELLPILDDFDRILDHLPAEPTGELKVLIDGTRLIHANFQKCLKHFQVEEVATDGEKFNPHWHEAVGDAESDLESGTIVQCHRKGYKLHDRLLRPAVVTVAK